MPTATCQSAAAFNAPLDGYLGVANSGGDTWAELMARTDATSQSGNTGLQTQIKCDGNTDEFDAAQNILAGYDISAVPAEATVTAARLYMYPTTRIETLAGGSLAITEATLTNEANGTLDLADWDGHPPLRLAADIAIAGLTLNQYNLLFTLSAAGLAYLQARIGGNAFFRIAPHWLLDGPPTWGSNQNSQMVFSSRDNATAEQRPYLEVDYTFPPQTAETPVLGLQIAQPQMTAVLGVAPGGAPSSIGFDPPPPFWLL